jgi:hypothetical protein
VQSADRQEKQAAEVLTSAEEKQGWVWLIFSASIKLLRGPSHARQSNAIARRIPERTLSRSELYPSEL